MAKKNLLAIVQDILNDLDSDEVNSINDTLEALQVAQIVQTTYEEMMTDGDWNHLKELIQLDPYGSLKLTTMTIPESVQEVLWVKYNKRTDTDTKDLYSEVKYLDPTEFIELLNQRISSNTNIDTITDVSGISLYILNDVPPTYFTSFDDENIVFDSYDSGVDANLLKTKTQAYILKEPSFTITDEFIPDLPSKAFPYLISEAKSVCFNAIKQSANPKEEQRSTRQRRRMSQDRWRIQGGNIFPNYGRK